VAESALTHHVEVAMPPSVKEPRKLRGNAHKRPLPAPGNVAAAYRDREKVILVTKDFMLNQLRRDAPRIAFSFDECAGGELDKISEVIGQTYGILAPKIIGTNLTERDLTSTSARLLHHAGTTFVGAVHLARGGFRRQYMSLIRSVFETTAVVIRLCADPKALDNFYAGTLGSTKAVNAANKAFSGIRAHLRHAEQRVCPHWRKPVGI
jgi:hypothetical protein